MESTPTSKPGLRRHVPVALAIVIAVNAGVFAYRPNGLPQLGLVLSFPTVLVGVVVGMARLNGRWRRQVLLIAGLLAAIPSGAIVGHRVRDFDFQFRRQGPYQAVVEQVLSGHIAVGDTATRLTIEKSLAYVVFARRTTTGVVRVEFFWGMGFPVKHTAYVYTSTDVPGDGAWDHWRYRRVADHWFEASD
jgi:hypothetical protein